MIDTVVGHSVATAARCMQRCADDRGCEAITYSESRQECRTWSQKCYRSDLRQRAWVVERKGSCGVLVDTGKAADVASTNGVSLAKCRQLCLQSGACHSNKPYPMIRCVSLLPLLALCLCVCMCVWCVCVCVCACEHGDIPKV